MMAFARSVHAEVLDHLREDDPRAVRSRADLRRINFVMGTRRIMLKALQRLESGPKRIIELGSGDASLMQSLSRRLDARWGRIHLTLLDRQNVVPDARLRAFAELGWQVDVLNIDILDWISEPPGQPYDVAIANLFLHHFRQEELAAILNALAQRAHALCVCEPRRSRLALLGSRMVGLLGANAVTREDAVLSVKAGFTEGELSGLMQPAFRSWEINEYPAGLFTHCLVAARKSDRQSG